MVGMRRLALTLLLVGIAAHLYARDPLSVGDDVYQAFMADAPQYKVIGPSIVRIPEGVVDFYKTKVQPDPEDGYYLVILDRYVVGVLQPIAEQPIILIDADGNGTLDYESRILRVPYWVVAREYQVQGQEPNNVKAFLDQALANFNSDSDPYASGAHPTLLADLIELTADANAPNRDLIYSLFDYYMVGDRHPLAALQAMRFLTETYIARHGEEHPLFYLHTLESYLGLGYLEDAAALADVLVTLWPGFIPGYVYQWELEQDPQRKSELYDRLKAAHPDHWIVRQL